MPARRLALAFVITLATSAPAFADDLSIDFERDVKPIFAKTCVRCHGAKKLQGGLALDTKVAAFTGGDDGPAIVPGKSAESRLYRYVAGLDEDTVMPPDGDELPAAQVATIKAWIDQGAVWNETSVAKTGTDHWSFKKPARPELPAVKQASWPHNEIDRFVLARLEKEGFSPSPEADRATLIRRLSLDLTGLPPSIEEVDAFLADTRADAYERLVDRLLASPQYGERWARFWLDRARFADTNGYEKDRERSVWPYRDWVIRAFNSDKPFDRFTVEQIAGDLLPNATTDQKVATGFHRNTMVNEEGGIDVEEFRFAAMVDRMATTSAVWLGLTIQCAQCHTHKYDPITQREYYSLMAFLNNADEPELDVPDDDQVRRRAAAEAEIRSLEQGRTLPDLEEKILAWEKKQHPVRWDVLRPLKMTSKKHATMTLRADGSVLVSGDKPNNDVYEIEVALPSTNFQDNPTALRLEVLPDPSLPDGGPGRAPLFSVGDFLLTEVTVDGIYLDPRPDDRSGSPTLPIVNSRDPNIFKPKPDHGPDVRETRRLALADASASYHAAGRPVSLAIDGITDTGWSVAGGIGKAHHAVFNIKKNLGSSGHGASPRKFVITLHQEYIHQTTIGRFRISTTNAKRPVKASSLPADVETTLLVPRDKRSVLQQSLIRDHFLSVTPELAALNKTIAEKRAALPKYPTSLVMLERKPEHARVTKIHKRGEFLKETDPVEPGVPAVLHALPSMAFKNRLGFANWLVADDNPLVGRVIVNQIWQAVFGRGIVSTPEDFGAQGSKPSHPELLDWLAVEFPSRGWSLKALQRLIVTSSTYRQSSKATPALLAKDPKNELLARGPRFRVDAETVRDIALAASGLLSEKLGGPSVFPPQPEGATSLAYGGNSWQNSTGADRYRRGLYTYLKRTAPYASFVVMDGPTSDTTCVRRERSNTPLQALTLLNDAVFMEAAQALAKRVIDPKGLSTEERATIAFRLCVARSPRSDELSRLVAFHDRQFKRARETTKDSEAEVAAWTSVARVLLNLDETITKE